MPSRISGAIERSLAQGERILSEPVAPACSVCVPVDRFGPVTAELVLTQVHRPQVDLIRVFRHVRSGDDLRERFLSGRATRRGRSRASAVERPGLRFDRSRGEFSGFAA